MHLPVCFHLGFSPSWAKLAYLLRYYQAPMWRWDGHWPSGVGLCGKTQVSAGIACRRADADPSDHPCIFVSPPPFLQHDYYVDVCTGPLYVVVCA